MSKKYKILAIITSLLSIVSAYALVIVPKLIGKAVDNMVGINDVNFDIVVSLLTASLLMYLLYFILSWFIAYVAHKIAIGFVYDLRSNLQYHLNRNPISYIDKTSHGSLLNLFTIDSELLVDGMYQAMTQLLNGVFVILITFYYMLKISYLLTVIVIVMVPLMYYTSKVLAKYSRKLFRQQQTLSAEMSSHVKEAVENHDLITNYNYGPQSIVDFEEVHSEYNKVGTKVQILGALVNPTIRVINNLNYALLGLVGAYMCIQYGLTVGTLMAFISYSILFTKPFNEFSAIISQIIAARASYVRIEKALNVPMNLDGGTDVDLAVNGIEFKNVDFSYDNENQIIKDLNLHIKPLSKVAIVGPTGAGKSTLINILMRYYDVDSGEIIIDDYNTNEISKKSLRSIMSIVLQEPWLSAGSIRDNIKYGYPEATDEQMIAASKQAGCYEFIMQLDNKFDTVIDPLNDSMSVGQKQMITIARAIIVDSPIIILDEATSNIDVLSEYKIQKAFAEVMVNKTSFFVAHHLETVIDADIILVMKEGRLIEQGLHNELMNLKGFYFEMYTSEI